MAFVNWFDYSSAVRGYHYYRNCWQPPPELKLVCSHDKNNPYDFFPSKVVVAESGMVVCHLPMEHSHVTKYTLDRKARHPNFYELLCIATDPRRSVNTMSHWNSYVSNCKKKELMKIYEMYIGTLYYQQEETHIVASFIDGGSEIEKNDEDRPS